MNETVEERLRRAIKEIRVKPWPIANIIPLLSEAADEIHSLEWEIESIYRNQTGEFI